MPTAYLLDAIPVRQTDDNGDPVPGALLYTYAAGTSTPLATYTDATGNTQHSNPIEADGDGFWPAIWISAVGYKLIAREPDSTLLWERDEVRSAEAAVIERLAIYDDGDDGAGMVGWAPQTTYAINTVGHKLEYLPIDVTDFVGVDPTGATSSLAGIQAAIAFAESKISGTGSLNATGVGIRFPPGRYLIDGTLTSAQNGIGFFGDPGRGTYLFGTGQTMFNIGDPTDAIRARYTTFQDLIIRNTSLTNTDTAIRFYRTIGTRMLRVTLVDWYVSVDGVRASTHSMLQCWFSNSSRTTNALAALRLQGTDETGTTGDTYTPGGGWHVTDCEFSGNSTSAYTESGWLLMSVDGFYALNCHLTGYRYSLDLNPDATPENCTITDVMLTQIYFDEPSTTAVAPRNIYVRGSVAPVIACDVGNTFSRYGSIRLTQVYHRGDTEVDRCLFVQVTDTGGAFYAAGRKVQDFQVIGGTARQSTNCAIQFSGRSTGDFFEWVGVRIEGVFFDANNSGGVAGNGSAITASCESILITGCVFGLDSPTPDYVVLVNLSDIGAGDDANPTAIVTSNDFSRAGATIELVHYTSAAGARVSVHDNIPVGLCQMLKQPFTTSTSDATPKVIWDYVIPSDGSSGYCAVVFVCSTTTGNKALVYEVVAGYRRISAGAVSISAGTGGISWNPDAMATPPTLTLVGNTITATVTGIAATFMTWVAYVTVVQSR